MSLFENGDPNEQNENLTPDPEQKPERHSDKEPSETETNERAPHDGHTEYTDKNEFNYAQFREVRSEPEPPRKKKKSMVSISRGGIAALIALCLMVSVLAGAGINAMLGGVTSGTPIETTVGRGDNPPIPGQNTANGNTETAPGVQFGGELSEHSALARVASECIQSVVVINVTETAVSYGQEYTTSGAGSGVIYTKDGYIITNYHVVGKDTKTISVVLHDGSVYEGKYIYGDEYADISVIKIEKNDCKPAKIGDSTKMLIGDTVLAIGNPLGYGLSVTDGIVSALARDVTVENTTMTLMQTSAAINSGNSGGGLFNAAGELIGIVNAKIGGTSVEGMGFAIPSSTVVKCINDLKDYGYITGKARLGVTVQTKQYQTWPYMQTHTYIQVTEVSENGSAAKSGLKPGDILQKFNGTEITSFATLSQQLTKYSVGDTITLTVRRPTIELTSSNLQEYLSSCEELEIKITFVEFNPNL